MEIDITEEDIREAVREMKAYLDITEDDLKRIYILALRHAKERLSRKISVKEVMTERVVTVKRDADIKEIARLLSENRISGLPVIDDEGKVIGIVSEADILASLGIKREHKIRDILRYLSGETVISGKKGETAGDIMTTPAITTGPDIDIRDVAAILDKKRVKRLPVVDRDGRLIGIISRADIVRAIG
jgi:CBS domain-containing membrane protein